MNMGHPCRPDIERDAQAVADIATAHGVRARILPQRYMLLTFLTVARMFPRWRQCDCIRLTAYAHDAPIAAVEAAVFVNGR